MEILKYAGCNFRREINNRSVINLRFCNLSYFKYLTFITIASLIIVFSNYAKEDEAQMKINSDVDHSISPIDKKNNKGNSTSDNNNINNNNIKSNIENEIESFYKNLPVLVTGGAGFIGSHLVEYLVNNLNAKVTVIDNLSTGNLDNLSNVWDKIVFIKDTIESFDACLNATWGQKAIFHLAAAISVPASMEDPLSYHNINITGTANLLEAARINKVDRFVFSSSSAVYGPYNDACSESAKCNPQSPYGYTKYISEFQCKQYAELFGINTVILRYFNVFGPKQNPNASYAAAAAKFTEQLKNNLPITIFGDGTQTRDFVHVDKVVEANLRLGALANQVKSEVFNIATGKSISILELVNNLKRQYPNYSQETIFLPARPGDVAHSKANCLKYLNLTDEFIAHHHVSYESYATKN